MKSMKKALAKFIFLVSTVLVTGMVPETQALTILIDPGHGGEDQGARHEYLVKGGNKRIVLLEKNICLQIAGRIYEELKKKHRVFLTRSIDRTVTLEERTEMAEKVKADIFISVHVNSSSKTISQGMETYYLDNHNDIAIKKIEHVENPKLKGDDLIANQILIDLLIQRTAPGSKKLGINVHSSIRKKVAGKFQIANRGLKAGLFYVLALSKRPAILLEAGFISNPKEARKLIDPHFQESYAQAVAAGIESYAQGLGLNEMASVSITR